MLCLCPSATRLGVKADAQMLVHALSYLVDLLTYLETSNTHLHLPMIAQETPARRGRFRKFAGLVTESRTKSKENFFCKQWSKKCKNVGFYEVIQFQPFFSNSQIVCLCSLLNKRFSNENELSKTFRSPFLFLRTYKLKRSQIMLSSFTRLSLIIAKASNL